MNRRTLFRRVAQAGAAIGIAALGVPLLDRPGVERISEIVTGADTAVIYFVNIPSAYNHLLLTLTDGSGNEWLPWRPSVEVYRSENFAAGTVATLYGL